MQIKEYYIATPAYNESRNIGAYFRSVVRAVRFGNSQFTLMGIYICVNGCTDDTKVLIQRYSKRYPFLKVRLLESDKGMNRALDRIMEEVQQENTPIVKIDADVRVDNKSIAILIRELQDHPNLQVVGAHPQARYYKGKNLYKRILTHILDVRSRYPLSQIAVYDVSKFHQTAVTSPQPLVPVYFELRSRIYFHGRFYAIRNKQLWRVPPTRIGDDTYLTLDVYNRFGYDSIRLRYDAVCTYNPSTSLRFHWRVYKRIFCDTYTLSDLPEFNNQKIREILKMEAVKLDWKYIRSLPLSVQLSFHAYNLIKKVNHFLFKLSPKYSDSLWTYKVKTS